MSEVGNIIEKKSIGINLERNGTHSNTELVNGIVQLKGIIVNGVTTYPETGEWTSAVVNVGDNFKEYDNLVYAISNDGNARVEILTRSSANGVSFNDWVSLDVTGKVQSPKLQYFQARIKFFSDISTTPINYDLTKYKSQYVNVTSSEVKLNKNLNFDMTKDSSYSEGGELHRYLIVRTEYNRIDKLNVIEKEVI